MSNLDELRAEFLRVLTVDSETKDRRRREYNQAIFDAKKGYSIWSEIDLDMVMEKFDKACRVIDATPAPLDARYAALVAAADTLMDVWDDTGMIDSAEFVLRIAPRFGPLRAALDEVKP